jgi:hypothetical protein
MSIPFPPERENDVTTLPFAGQRQRFTGALPAFAVLLALFLRLPLEVAFLLPDFFTGALEDDFDDVPGALALLLWLLEGGGRGFFLMLSERVEAVLGGFVSRNF